MNSKRLTWEPSESSNRSLEVDVSGDLAIAGALRADIWIEGWGAALSVI
jgi:hypothetical protein